MKGSMLRKIEIRDRLKTTLPKATAILLAAFLSACNGDGGSNRVAVEKSLSGDQKPSASSVFDACGEAPEGSIAAQIPSIDDEPIPGSFSCGPSYEFIEARRAASAQR